MFGAHLDLPSNGGEGMQERFVKMHNNRPIPNNMIEDGHLHNPVGEGFNV